MRTATLVSLLGAAFVTAALGAPVHAASKKDKAPPAAVFFPEAPAPPRLQFLTSYQASLQVATAGKKGKSFADWVVGTDKEKDSSKRIESPYGLAVRDGKMYVCDVASERVHVVDAARGGYAVLAAPTMKHPVNIAIDAEGNKYVTDTGASLVHVFDANDQYVRSMGEPSRIMPIDAAVGGDELFVSDLRGGKVEVWSKDGKVLRTISRKGMGPDELTEPVFIAVGPDGNLYVSDKFLQTVKVFDPRGNFLNAIGGPGGDLGSFARPKGVVVDPHGTVFVADAQWDAVQAFDKTGQLLMVWGKPGPEPYAMGLPSGLAIDTTSLKHFEKYIDRNFEAEYLLFVANQFGKNKIAVYAFGRDKRLPASAYEIDAAEVQKARARLKEAARREPK